MKSYNVYQLRCRTAIFVWAVICMAENLRGDALVVSTAMHASTIVEVFIEHEQVRTEIEVGANNLPSFLNLLPDDLYEKLGHDPKPQDVRFNEFIQNDWNYAADGELLAGEIRKVEIRKRVVRDPITGEPLSNQPADAEIVISAELLHRFAGQPSTLTITPPSDEQGSRAAVNIGFVVYHLGVAVNDFRYLSQSETLQLDWKDPWYTRFERKTLRRQYYAPAAAFLYVEPFEVRKEIVFRPLDLQAWIDLGVEARGVIPADRREEICQKAADFLMAHTPVAIDGQSVPCALDRVNFITRTLRTSGVVEAGADIDVGNALIGAIYVYPIKSLPEEVELAWQLFNDRITQVPAVATDEAGGLPSILEVDAPVLHWKNFLTNPTTPQLMEVGPPRMARIEVPTLSVILLAVAVLSLAVALRWSRGEGRSTMPMMALAVAALVGGLLCLPHVRASWPNPFATPRLAPEEAESVIHALLHNIYRAFDYRDESLIYDRLAASVSGELLNDVYVQMREGMELENQGGARVKVDQVSMRKTDVEPSAANGLVYRCSWTAAGSVGHWGHTHRRTNQYDAIITLAPIEGNWRITDISLLDSRATEVANFAS